MADKLKTMGERDAHIRYAHKVDSGLTDKDYLIVRSAAAKAMAKVAELDRIAKPLTLANIEEMKRIKSRYTSNYEKLEDLNRQRTSAFEQAIAEIKKGLGEARFTQYDAYVRTTFGPKIGVQRFSLEPGN